MITLLVPPGSLVSGAIITLDEDEAHHLSVRRAVAGANVRLLDGAGVRGEGELSREGKDWTARVSRVASEPKPVDVTLAVGAGDRDRFAAMVEQSAQLGATSIIPLVTSLTAGVATRLREGHIDRVRRRGREALKQCGAVWAPIVREPLSIEEFLEHRPAGTGWLADQDGEGASRLGPWDPLTVVVGPEGGFSDDERRRFLVGGFLPVRLGTHLLRFETAALAALTVAWLARQGDQHD